MLNEERAQVSVELLLILAAVIAVAILLVNSMQTTAEQGEKIAGKNSKDIVKKIRKI